MKTEEPAMPCPEPQQLKLFVLGQLPVSEVEAYEQHLSQCDPCVETIAGLNIEDTFTSLTRQALDESDPVGSNNHTNEEEIVDGMIDRMGRWSVQESSSELTEAQRTSDDLRCLARKH